MFDLVRSQSENPVSADFVAIAYQHDEEDPHSGFVIQQSGNLLEFHFKGLGIIYQPLESDFLHKILTCIHEEDVPAFVAHCRNIQRKAKPIYGYFYSGEWYDALVNFIGNRDLGQRMTCVGFCLNILRGFLENDYLAFEDWDATSHAEPGYLESYCQRYALEIEKVRDSHRRITPLELFVSAFCSPLPIPKHEIDAKIEEVLRGVESKLKATL